MCGIAGYLRLRPETSAPIAAPVAKAMLAALHRRGPDGEGEWRSADDLCWLGHRRLAIIDLHTGEQPMCNEDGTVWTVFNGEIYNHLTLRAELEGYGHRFKTRSDAEVLVHGYEQWGLRGLAERLQGIFAFAGNSNASNAGSPSAAARSSSCSTVTIASLWNGSTQSRRNSATWAPQPSSSPRSRTKLRT